MSSAAESMQQRANEFRQAYAKVQSEIGKVIVGHTEIVRLRDKAKAALGARFDVRDFNDAVIQAGAVPLAVLSTAIDDYVAKARG